MKTQAGLRLSVEVWDKLKIAAKINGVSAANLIDALGAEWLMGMQLGDPWAHGVLGSARERQNLIRNRPRRRKTADIIEIGPKTAENAK